MARDYQRQKNNKFILPEAVYKKTLWEIRDYERKKGMTISVLEESPPRDGQPSGSKSPGSSVESKAARREDPLYVTNAIEEAFALVPKEYRQAVWDNIVYNARWPMYAGRTTYARWKSFFIYEVAKKIDFI